MRCDGRMDSAIVSDFVGLNLPVMAGRFIFPYWISRITHPCRLDIYGINKL